MFLFVKTKVSYGVVIKLTSLYQSFRDKSLRRKTTLKHFETFCCFVCSLLCNFLKDKHGCWKLEYTSYFSEFRFNLAQKFCIEI